IFTFATCRREEFGGYPTASTCERSQDRALGKLCNLCDVVVCVSIPGNYGTAPYAGSASHLDHHVWLLDRHRKCLADIGARDHLAAGFDRDRELADRQLLRIAVGLAGRDLELPAVPRAAQELALPRDPVFAGAVGLHEPDHRALAQSAARMRAAVGKRVERAVDVEHADVAALDGHALARAGRNLVDSRDHMPAHARRSKCGADGRAADRGKNSDLILRRSHALACDRLEGWPQAPNPPPSFETQCARQGATALLLRMRSECFSRAIMHRRGAVSTLALADGSFTAAGTAPCGCAA